MTGILTTLGAVLAVAVSGVGLVVTIEQVTLRARLRKTIETSKALAEHEEGERKAILTSIHDVAVARLTAGWLIPGWRFAEAGFWLLGAPLALGITTYREGLTSQTWTFAFAALVMLGLSNRRALRLVLERQRITRQYLRGERVGPPRVGLIHQMEGGTWREFGFGAIGSLGALMIALGFGDLAHDPTTPWPIGLVLGGLVVTSVTFDFIKTGAARPAEGAGRISPPK